jgi:hypothetical protein
MYKEGKKKKILKYKQNKTKNRGRSRVLSQEIEITSNFYPL